LSVSHVVYGLRLAANIAIPGLTVQPDTQAVDVRIWLEDSVAFPPTFSEPFEYLYVSGDCDGREEPNLRVAVDSHAKYLGFFYRDGTRFAVERRGQEVWADWPEGCTLEDACTYLLGPIMGFVLRLRGITCLHASAVAFGDYAIALTGLPGAGKSTLAAAFARSGFRVLSDDVAALTDEGGQLLVQPGYPRVNLWPDSVRALCGSENALPRITPTWDKRYLALDRNGSRFATEALPLRAIYVLGAREAALSDPIIEEVAGSEAFMVLVANTYVNYLLDRDMRSREFGALSRVMAAIPIRRIRPTTNTSGLATLCEAIAADATGLTTAQKSPTVFPRC
jgi:hypothetical protein